MSSLPTLHVPCVSFTHFLCSPRPGIQALHWPKGFLHLLFQWIRQQWLCLQNFTRTSQLGSRFSVSSRPVLKELSGKSVHRRPEFLSLFSKHALCFIDTVVVRVFQKINSTSEKTNSTWIERLSYALSSEDQIIKFKKKILWTYLNQFFNNILIYLDQVLLIKKKNVVSFFWWKLKTCT